MSLKAFILYLQEILTMIDPKNEYSVALGKAALSSTIELARKSNKVDLETSRAMIRALNMFEYLAQNASDYAGKPGKTIDNEKRRRRLMMSILPSC